MSANNQTLIKNHDGKFYIFDNIQAESWCDENGEHINELYLKDAVAICDTRDEALTEALKIEQDDEMGGTEYGIQFEQLQKDGTGVVVVVE